MRRQKGDRRMLKLEWKKLLSNKLMLVVIVAIIAIPTIYTTLFLGSMWDPYGNMDKLPVAVVNEDKPVEYEGETLNIGKEMVENLKEDGSLNFSFTDKERARQGLKDGSYYMVITIPEDFSANAATLTREKPEKMELSYETNPGTNYIASKMSETAMEKIQSSVREEVTRTYAEAVFEQIGKAGDGMEEAADGSGKLQEGTRELASGNEQIEENLQVLADSTLVFRDGSQTLEEGLKTYTDGVTAADKGARELQDGASELNKGTKTLDSGAKELAGGSESLDAGAQSLEEGMGQLEGKIPGLSQGVRALSQGSSQLAAGVKTAGEGSKSLKAGAEQTDRGLASLQEGLDQLNSAASQLPGQTQKLQEGTNEVYEGAAQLSQGMKLLEEQAVPGISASIDQVNGQLQDGGKQVFDSVKEGADQLKSSADQLLAGIQGTESMSQETGSGDQLGDTLEGNAQEAGNQAEAAQAAAENLGGVESTDASYLSDSLQQAIDSGDIDAVASVAWEAVAAAQQNADAANEAGSRLQEASQALGNSSAALSQDQQTMAEAARQARDMTGAGLAGENSTDLSSVVKGLQALSEGLGQLSAQTETAGEQYLAGVDSGMEQLKSGIGTQVGDSLSQLREGADRLTQGSGEVNRGVEQLTEAAPALAGGIQSAKDGAGALKTQGTEALVQGAGQLDEGFGRLVQGSSDLDKGVQEMQGQLPALSQGVEQLSQGAKDLKQGTGSLKTGAQTLSQGAGTLSAGMDTLVAGTSKLSQGTGQLTANNQALLGGAVQLEDGASQISSGASQLHDGSKTLGSGIEQLAEGTRTLKDSLAEGAKQIRDTNKGEDTADMFAAPVETKETQITRVENNGHAMAPYMMSVALWVGCIAFSLMYPLTKYSGKLKSGLAWWGSKASVLYLIALLQAAVMIFMLHLCDGFEPVEMGKTLAVACLASVAFMSVMYFFTNTFGKVGSFLMLVFMVIQLAGSVGTYPLELSGSFVPYLHDWVPFTYTVEAFRSTISGGESIQEAVIFLTVLWIVFTLLTILEFQIRTLKMKRGKRTLDNWLEEKGLA